MGAAVLLSAVGALVLILAGATVSASSSPRVFTVGGEGRGWRNPAPGEETYNHWASRNRFHAGDLLYFRYAKNDSVLVVTGDDYKLCRGDRHALRLDGGEEASFRLERSGLLYFISGAPGHCNAGQRLAVRIMAQHGRGATAPAESPAPSPAPAEPPAPSPVGSGSTTPGSGSGAVHKTPPRAKSSDAAFGGNHAVVVALGLGVGAAILVLLA